MTVRSEQVEDERVEDERVVPYGPFHVEVARTLALGPSFRRVTFTGESLEWFADNGFDQRIKVVLPLPGSGLAHFPEGPDWYAEWRTLPEGRKNPVRTYTVRAVRPHLRELDVDFALHGDGGPASRWAAAARPGQRIVVVGPDSRHAGPALGREWAPPAGAGHLLLAGDETAVPAISAIAERLTGEPTATILLEVPEAADLLDLRVAPGVEVTWLPRAGRAARHGELLVPALRAAVDGLAPGAAAPVADLADVDVDTTPLWEVPERPADGAGLYAWLDGEAGVVKTLRRFLVQEAGVDRAAVAFMGYWRLGRAEAA
jgi:NADPH-dependent ferric siderophore reductase